MPVTANRRHHVRTAAEIACKLLQHADCKYRSALTADISAGGALLTLRTPKPLTVGETLAMTVNWNGRPLLSREELINATVVRTGPLLDQTQLVAVRFDEPQHEADALLGADAA